MAKPKPKPATRIAPGTGHLAALKSALSLAPRESDGTPVRPLDRYGPLVTLVLVLFAVVLAILYAVGVIELDRATGAAGVVLTFLAGLYIRSKA